ncbi:MAG: aspartyl-phosphate phosphatase Spo0E family protein [Firmicutes bacterium]|nr:aspartyl-phosphate phosphatase Spo0E family protein [Bacillota bacterium]
MQQGLDMLGYLRQQMIDLAQERGTLTHSDVVAASQRLDQLIVQYQRQLMKQGANGKQDSVTYLLETSVPALMRTLDVRGQALQQSASGAM